MANPNNIIMANPNNIIMANPNPNPNPNNSMIHFNGNCNLQTNINGIFPY